MVQMGKISVVDVFILVCLILLPITTYEEPFVQHCLTEVEVVLLELYGHKFLVGGILFLNLGNFFISS